MNLKPLRDRIVVKPDTRELSSIILVDNKEVDNMGTVIAVGPGKVRNGRREEMPVEVFFREPEDLSELENTAIAACRGSVLDLGAGAGAHALLLQALEFDVTALDNSPGCVETMTLSGMNKVVDEDYKKHKSKYDTLLLLMNYRLSSV